MKTDSYDPKAMNVLETGLEVSKILAQNGFEMSKPCFHITWGQVAEQIGDVFAEHGLPLDRIDEDVVINMAMDIQDLYNGQDILAWDKVIRDYVTGSPEFNALVDPECFADPEDDCPLDGDAQSALASCGWGMDEDYGCFDADPFDGF